MDKQAMMDKARQMVANIDDLPTIPAVATQVLQLLDTSDVNLDEVADLMLTDQVMTARVMKMINSPIYRPSHELNSLKRALVYLGQQHIKEIALTSSFISAFENKGGAINISAFWVHAFGVGMVSRIIAEKIEYEDVEKAYLAGIIHDIGEVVLSHYYTEPFANILKTIQEKPLHLVDLEQETFQTTHAEIGFCIAEKWNFPEAYQEVILHHHTPHEATKDPVLCAIVNLADLFSSVRGLYYSNDAWAGFNLVEEDGWRILKEHHARFAQLDVERFCYELDDAVPSVKELVASIFAV